MDVLTLLRNTRDDSREPSSSAFAAGRVALLDRANGTGATAVLAQHRPRRRGRVLTWTAAGVAAGLAGVLVVGNVSLSTQSAHASELLRSAATETTAYADLVPGSGEFLRSRTHARWDICTAGDVFWTTTCEPSDQILDVYMPADSGAQWVMYRDWGKMPGKSDETLRSLNGVFYGAPWVLVDYADIPTDGAAAYEWVNGQYSGGSASRDEDNFVRIASILQSGLVPAPQRAALLDALSRVPGVTATDGVANLDGVAGVAIGRNEPVRAGERQEIIIDPNTGLIIGERTLSGATVFGWGPNKQVSLTAIETTVVDAAP